MAGGELAMILSSVQVVSGQRSQGETYSHSIHSNPLQSTPIAPAQPGGIHPAFWLFELMG
jgi:hypothetical protein